LLIQNARLLSARDGLDGVHALLIEDGRIAAIGEAAEGAADAEVMDAAGLCLAPGLIDLFAFCTEPEQDGVESLLTLSAAAAAGGYAHVCAHTELTTAEQATFLRERAAYAACDIVIAARATLERELLNFGALKAWGVRVVYDDAGVDNPLRMRDVLFRARKHEVRVLARCRDRRLYGEGLMREGELARILDFPIIPASAEAVVVARDIILAVESGATVHLGHISTSASVEIIRAAKARGVPVTCSVEPAYLALTSKALQNYNTLAKLDPPLGNPGDLAALRAAVADGTIDAIASGHTPLPMAQKHKSLVTAAPGASMLETALAVSLTALYHDAGMPLPAVLDKLTAAPAEILGLDAGRLRVGDPADCVLFDPDAEWVCTGADFVSRGQNTPFEGQTLRGRPVRTLKAGRVIHP
jgi:dihydroorotase